MYQTATDEVTEQVKNSDSKESYIKWREFK